MPGSILIIGFTQPTLCFPLAPLFLALVRDGLFFLLTISHFYLAAWIASRSKYARKKLCAPPGVTFAPHLRVNATASPYEEAILSYSSATLTSIQALAPTGI